MIGEYIRYSRGVIFGGIYDDRFLLTITPASQESFPDAEHVSPYPGATDMLAVDTDDAALVAATIAQMLPEIPAKRARK